MTSPARLQRRLSLRTVIALYIAGIALVLALGYSKFMLDFFIEGLKLSNAIPTASVAMQFAEQYKQDRQTPLPDTPFGHGVIGAEQLPDWVRIQFPQTRFNHKEFLGAFWNPSDRTRWPEPGRYYIQLYIYDLDDGEQLLLYSHFTPDMLTEGNTLQFEEVTLRIVPILLVSMGTVILLTWLLVSYMRRPTAQLAQWASALTVENWQQKPDFRFSELNEIAEKLQQAFYRINDVLAREQLFQRHASHELCTPIAVLKANVEVLNKLDVMAAQPKPVQRSWQRIGRASKNMQHIVETLLWLSRKTDIEQSAESVNVAQMLREVVEENRYLLQGKPVEISQSLQDIELQLQPTPLRMVLNNLVRNALQYTEAGHINLSVTGSTVKVANQTLDSAEQAANESSEISDEKDYGYGLGLRLVEQLCDKLAWQYQVLPLTGGRQVTVRLISALEPDIADN